MTRWLRGGLVVLVAGLAVGLAGPAGAATLTRVGQIYTFTADAGEADGVTINPGAAGRFLLSDTADTIVLGAGTVGCTGGGTITVDCPLALRLDADLGDLGDATSISDAVPMEFHLDGQDGADSLDAGGDDDILIGGPGNDILFTGGPGNDLIVPGAGTDTNISGGEGSDTISYLDGRVAGVFVHLTVFPTIGGDGETFTGIEEAIGTEFDDTLVATGAGFRTVLSGFGGNDTLAGGTLNDLLTGGPGADTISGNEGNDILRGNDGNDLMSGGDGDDYLIGGLGADSLAGGNGSDTASYADRGTSVEASLVGSTQDGDTYTFIENLEGGGGDDTLRGDGGANTLTGGYGMDTLIGGAGPDTLLGFFTSGSEGAPDTASYEERATPVVTGLVGVHQDGDTYDDIQNLTGGGGNDTLSGDGGANILVGLNGADTLIGGAGADTLRGGAANGAADASIDVASYSDRAVSVIASLTGVKPDGDVYSDINGLEGGSGNDTLTGNSLANELRGLAGNDVLIGGADADVLDGGPGTGDIASYEDGPGVDADLASGDNFHNDVYSSIEGLRGGGGPDFLRGDGGPNMLDGGDGNDELIGGLGADTLIGGAGFNTASYQDGRPPAVGVPDGIYLNLAAPPGPDGDTYLGIDRFIGTNRDDEMIAGDSAVEFQAAEGDDVVRTRGGPSDVVDCGDGDDAHEAHDTDTSVNCELVQRGKANMAIADASVLEGNSGQSLVSLVVTLDQATVDGASASFVTSDGSAISPADYLGGPGTVTFERGETTVSVNVTVIGDVAVEPDETFTVTLSAQSSNVDDILDNTGIATITNDDVATPGPAGIPALTISNARVKEGNRGTKAMKFRVRLSAPSAQPVTVRFKTQKGTAKPRQDFVGRSVLLTFAPGQTEIVVVVKIKGDLRDERNEKFKALLLNAAGATVADADGVGTIRDNDP
jgi:Ca2+-binding RTX toxin-like protein